MITGTLQYLLIKLAEEATELANATSKAALFGMLDKKDAKSPMNVVNIEQEFNDIYSILLLINRVTDSIVLPDSVSVDNKLARLAKFTHIAAEKEGVSPEVANNLQECVDLMHKELNNWGT